MGLDRRNQAKNDRQTGEIPRQKRKNRQRRNALLKAKSQAGRKKPENHANDGRATFLAAGEGAFERPVFFLLNVGV